MTPFKKTHQLLTTVVTSVKATAVMTAVGPVQESDVTTAVEIHRDHEGDTLCPRECYAYRCENSQQSWERSEAKINL